MKHIISRGHEFNGLYVLDSSPTLVPKSIACTSTSSFSAPLSLPLSFLLVLKKLFFSLSQELN